MELFGVSFGACFQAGSVSTKEEEPAKAGGVARMTRVPSTHGVRTMADEALRPAAALRELMAGNARFKGGEQLGWKANDGGRRSLVQHGQSPLAAIIGCADSRCPVEILFDAQPGDLFVLRNAGNTCTHAEGAMAGSLEYALGHLRTKLVLVLGHTNCGAVAGACATHLAHKKEPAAKQQGKKTTALENLLNDLTAVAAETESQMPPGSAVTVETLAPKAIKVNVLHTMDFLLKNSEPIREKVRSGEVEVHGAIYHLETGEVEFLGTSPREAEMLRAS